MKTKKFSSVENIIRKAKKGEMYILVDDENRENEGDLVIPASNVSPKKIKKVGKSIVFEFKIESKFSKYLIPKASILINGVSLTISKIKGNNFQIWCIPHTLKLTNLSNLKVNDIVNIEIDILSKYVKKFYENKKV